jgi:hypothetical protein
MNKTDIISNRILEFLIDNYKLKIPKKDYLTIESIISTKIRKGIIELIEFDLDLDDINSLR